MGNIITDGKHFLSGIGHTTKKRDFYTGVDEPIDVDLFCIDGVTYGAYIDPDDGWRSYGYIGVVENEKCQYRFPPQEVIVKNEKIDKSVDNGWDGWNDRLVQEIIHIYDAVNGKKVLTVGTDYSEDYYPCAIFNYSPENLEINKNR